MTFIMDSAHEDDGPLASHAPRATAPFPTPIPASVDPMSLDESSDLETVLGAWHDATIRLEHTHEALRAEVQRLTDELEVKNRELARKNRLADLGQMASHVAHEVRNSLVPVGLYLTLLRRRLTSDDGAVEILDHVETAFTALGSTVNDLLHFTSDREPVARWFRVVDLLQEIHDSLAPQFEAQGVSVRIEASESLSLEADRDMIRRAVLNLALNALDAMPDGGRLFLSASTGESGVEITVRDSGVGLTDEAMRRASEPFFSTKSTGTGLGLAIVYRILEVHGGAVDMANAADGGAVFTLQFRPTAKELAA